MTLYSKAILATNFRTRSNAPFFGVFCVHHDPECYYQERTPNGKLSCVDMQCTSICGNEMIEGKECFPFTIQAKERFIMTQSHPKSPKVTVLIVPERDWILVTCK